MIPVLSSDCAFSADSPNPKSFCTQGSCPLQGSGTGAGGSWGALGTSVPPRTFPCAAERPADPGALAAARMALALKPA